MPRQTLSSIPAARRQHLLVEFASLKQAAPPGVYMSLSPTTANLWFGVLFVRKGPYKGGIFKFTIYFPHHYPSAPPTVTFQTPTWHPLAYPSSSATPGILSLRHGFPRWFSAEKGLPGGKMGRAVNTIEVLDYIKSVFDNDAVLDSIPASAVGNMGAWRAWGARDKSEVWVERVAAAVNGSRSDGMLYAAGEGDEPIRFLEMSEGREPVAQK